MVSEKFNSEGDAPLANRWMDDEFWPTRFRLYSVAQELSRSADVVDLVKYQAFGKSQMEQAQSEGEQRDDEWSHGVSLSENRKITERI